MIFSGHTYCPQKPGTCSKTRMGWARTDPDAPRATVGGGGPAFRLLFRVLKADRGAFRPTACWAAVSVGNLALPLQGPRSGAGPRAGTPVQVGAPVSELCSWLWSSHSTQRAARCGEARNQAWQEEGACLTGEGDVNAGSCPCSRPVRLPGPTQPVTRPGEDRGGDPQGQQRPQPRRTSACGALGVACRWASLYSPVTPASVPCPGRGPRREGLLRFEALPSLGLPSFWR